MTLSLRVCWSRLRLRLTCSLCLRLSFPALLPPAPAVREERLRRRSRNHLTEEELRRRLAVARREIERMGTYDYVVVNDEIEDCVERLRCIVMAERTSWRVAGPAGEAIARAFRDAG